MSELPVYTPSGQGGQVDLKNILVSQMLAWGTFKHQFKSKYKAVAGTHIVDGHEVFNDLQVKGRLGPDDDVRKFLLFIGFSNDELDKMNADMNNGDYKIETAHLTYQANESYELIDFEFAIQLLLDEISKYDSIEISLRNYAYLDGYPVLPRKSIQQFGINYNTEMREKTNEWDTVASTNTTLWMDGRTESDEAVPPVITVTGITPQEKVFPKNMIFQVMKNGVNVADTIPRPLLEMIGIVATLESTKITATFVSESTHQIIIPDTSGAGNDRTFHEIRSVYSYDFSQLTDTYLKTLHTSYAIKYRDRYNVNSDMTEEEKDRFVPREMISDLFWAGFSSLIEEHARFATDGLFYIPPPPPAIGIPGWMQQTNYDDWDKPPTRIYMLYDGIDKVKPEVFGYYVSAFMHFRIEKKKDGWLKRFLGGLIKAFLSLVDAIVGIFLKVPLLKQVTELILSVIGKVAGIDVKGARNILKQIIALIIVAIISYFLPPLAPELFAAVTAAGAATTVVTVATITGLSVGLVSAISMMITYGSYALQVYNVIQQQKVASLAEDIAMDNANADYAQRKAAEMRDKVKEAFMGTMGNAEEHDQSNEMMYNIMFNPFTNHAQAVPPLEFNSEHKLY